MKFFRPSQGQKRKKNWIFLQLWSMPMKRNTSPLECLTLSRQSKSRCNHMGLRGKDLMEHLGKSRGWISDILNLITITAAGWTNLET